MHPRMKSGRCAKHTNGTELIDLSGRVIGGAIGCSIRSELDFSKRSMRTRWENAVLIE
jgi:hypothetical protein